MLSLDATRKFVPATDGDFFEALPSAPGVFLLEMSDATSAPYLAQTADIRRAAERLLREPDAASKRLNLRAVVSRIRYRMTASKFERFFVLYLQTRELFPQTYGDRLKLRPPALLKVNVRNSYPRCYVTRRVRADQGFYFGPFPSRRIAESFNEGVLDLFKIRRCKIKIRRDPTFPGCVYSEMKMCMAPCFAGCTKEEYDADVASLLTMLDTHGTALTNRLEDDREAASEALDFERAAALHKRIEKVKAALHGLPEVIRRLDELDAVILQRGAMEKLVMMFPVVGGLFREPFAINFADASEPRSVESILREALPSRVRKEQTVPPDTNAESAAESAPDEATTSSSTAPAEPEGVKETYARREASAELSEHLSLIARWFYSKPRDGEILFSQGDWPYRRILRACARLLTMPPAKAEEKPPAAPAQNGTATSPETK
jgi:excinuclease ABC subunit C